jgi:hypothetical protein
LRYVSTMNVTYLRTVGGVYIGDMAHLRHLPKPRHWFSGAAVLGALIALYSGWVAFVQMPRDSGGLRWWVLGIGLVLSLAVWYSLAKSNADSERHKGVADERFQAMRADNEEEAKRAQERYEALQERHRETREALASLSQLVRSKEAVEAQSGPVGKPLAAKINEHIVDLQGTIMGSGGLALSIGLSGNGVVPAGTTSIQVERQKRLVAAVTEARPLLDEITRNPPKTAEEVSRAVKAVSTALPVASARTQAQGLDDTADPLGPTPSTPDTEAHPSPTPEEERPET